MAIGASSNQELGRENLQSLASSSATGFASL